MWSLLSLIVTGGLIRLILICYGRIHDYAFDVKFTDVDYQVFTDAAEYLSDGGSPYQRSTYRYSPILAYLLLPNGSIKDFGKLLFCGCDLIGAWLIYSIVKGLYRAGGIPLRSSSTTAAVKRDTEVEDAALAAVALWLFNPITAIISARGNAEGLIAAIVLLVLWLLINQYWLAAAVIHGLFGITLKIYPVLYIPSIFVYLCEQRRNPKKSAEKEPEPPESFASYIIRMILNVDGYVYVTICLGSFAAATWLSYALFGDQFLNEAVLYHVSRVDVRHNFSPYFYVFYLAQSSWYSQYIGLAAFVPQAALTIIFALRYGRTQLPFAWFLTTYAFVSFNKVCTSQYFVWYLSLLPLILQLINQVLSVRQMRNLVGAWFGGQGVWLLAAYLLEFKGWNSLIAVWLSSLLFLAVNVWCLAALVMSTSPLINWLDTNRRTTCITAPLVKKSQ